MVRRKWLIPFFLFSTFYLFHFLLTYYKCFNCVCKILNLDCLFCWGLNIKPLLACLSRLSTPVVFCLHRGEHRAPDSVQSVQKTWSSELQSDQNCGAALCDDGGENLMRVHFLCVNSCFNNAANSCECATGTFLSSIYQELVTQRQKVREERDRLQAQLEHFRRCLTLPSIHWGRGQVNVHPSRWPNPKATYTPGMWCRFKNALKVGFLNALLA